MRPHLLHIKKDMKRYSSPFIDPRVAIRKHRTHLPHWQQRDRFQFVTWHLGDALPAEKREQLIRERDIWLKCHPQPWDEKDEQEYHRLFSDRVEKWLDAGMSSCLLKQPELSQIVYDALLYFDGTRVHMDSFVVMPNHVHALFVPMTGHTLEQLLHSWKSFTAHAINARLTQTGNIWMTDYWDRMIRSAKHYWRVRRYIEENPEKAGLRKSEYRIWQREKPLLEELIEE